MARRLAPAALVLAALAAWLVLRGGEQTHSLRAAFTAALQVVPGQRVQIAGRQVGEVESVKLVDGRAVVHMRIHDEAWPLRRGTTAALRYGSPLGYALRYVDLRPGPRTAPPLPEGGLLTDRNTLTPVEFDDTPRIFDPPTRRNFARLLKNAGRALDGAGPDIREFLDAGGPGAEEVSKFTADLAADPHALRTLVVSAALASEQIARNQQRLGPLVTDAAITMEAFVSRAENLGELLDEAPSAMAAGERALAHLNRTSGRLERLAQTLGPGARELRRMAPVTARLMSRLTNVAPQLTALLRTGSETAPLVTKFLDRSDAVLPATGRGLAGLTPVIGCLRPYAPEFAGLLSTSQGVYGSYDARGHYIRSAVSTYPYTIPGAMSPQQMVEAFPKLKYGFPRPPGENVKQPWFQPQCGITPAGLDAAQDLEGVAP